MRHTLLGRTAREVLPALLAAGYEQQDALVSSRGEEISDRLEMITHRDGSAGWYLADKVPVRDAAGEVIALAGISRDLRAAAPRRAIGSRGLSHDQRTRLRGSGLRPAGAHRSDEEIEREADYIRKGLNSHEKIEGGGDA